MAGNFTRYILNLTNIPWTVSRHELALYFSQFGYVRDASIIFDKQTGFSQGYGSVTFLKKEHVNSAINHEHILEGKTLSISMKKNNNGIRQI